MNRINSLIIILIIFISSSCQPSLKAEPEIFIRFNQLGYLPSDIKTAVVLSTYNLTGKQISIMDSQRYEKVFTTTFGQSNGSYGNFGFTYMIDFSSIKAKGEYHFQYAQQKTFRFKIDENVYKGVADSLLEFFKVQRCGYTNPLMHNICHISDAGSLIDGKRVVGQKIDVTGGWHDAGDYVKILNTTAFSTYMLLFSYEFAPAKFNFDKNGNKVPDILEEAKVGLDWMLRAYYDKYKVVTQVQDLRDHDVGWRMPEDDPVGFDRPAYVGMGKNLIGIYAATMALAARIWKENLNVTDFSEKCLYAAQNIYSIYKRVSNVDSTGSGVYIDNNYEGKMALGAVELYMTTNKISYLNDATVFADSARSDFWWSWGNINSLAHYRLAKYFPKYADYIMKNLNEFNKRKNFNLFGKGVTLNWGTNVTLLGITLQNILYSKIRSFPKYDSVSVFARDYILGRNSWGVSFLSSFGKNTTRNLHHQISFLKGRLPGGFAAGPATKQFVDNFKIAFDKPDRFAKFQTDDNYYRDDRNDYITNEPTITGNATAIFVFGNLSRK